MNRGILNSWNLLKRYGWVLDITKGSPMYGRLIFLHETNYISDDGVPKVGDTIDFQLGPGLQGHRYQAINAHLALDQSAPGSLPVEVAY